MKSIGVVICNYNKKESVLDCIQTVLESTITDYDIYVVDNASSDGSAEAILDKYGSAVTVIRNESNLGGSGGFNTGIRMVISRGYSYLCCLDNDVLLDENALECMRDFLKKNQEVGMVGAKIYHMHKESYIQQYGLEIDFQNYQARTLYADVLDDETVPDMVYCDTVAACALMLPSEVVRKVGIMPEDNFIYWDDMEWGYRIRLAGYKVAAIAAAKALHEMGSNRKRENTFIDYYMLRNRIRFFMKNTPERDLEKMSVNILNSIFHDIFEAMYNREYNISQTIVMAYKDALDGVMGQAQEGRILQNDGNISEFVKFFGKVKSIRVQGDSEWLISVLEEFSLPVAVNQDQGTLDATVQICDSVFHIPNIAPDTVYVDLNLNVVSDKEDVEIVKSYHSSRGLFLYMNQKLFIDSAKRITQK